ncbi:MAG: O-antigen ligase family protein [Candidatus Rokubacteria bacterium]|nr:O-antigen ligase family protein [Candidatus Rokubacteria bacterium]MBI3825285.1 O-antigen ligase family protein [Candidatus Rokubacteria bacterium]
MDRLVRDVLLGAFVLGLGVSITLSETALALLAVRWLVRVLTGRAERVNRWPLALPVLAWIAVSLLAAALSPHPGESLTVASKGLLLIVALYVLVDALPKPVPAERFVAGLLAAVTIASLAGIAQVGACAVLGGSMSPPTTPVIGRYLWKCHRARGFYSIYMTLAGVLNLVLLAALPRLTIAPRRRWMPFAWVVGALALALTYVRGAWLGFLVGLGALVGLVRRGRLLVAVGLLVLIAAVLLVPAVRRRAESIADPADPTARDRWSMWRSGVAIARDHPLLGIGPGQVKHVYRLYAEAEALQRSRGHLHNTPLQILVERGALGLAAWLAVYATFFVQSAGILRRLPPDAALPRALVTGGMAAIAAFLVAGLTEYNFGDSEVVMVAWSLMSLPFIAPRDTTPPPRF